MDKNAKYKVTLDSKPAKRMRTVLTLLLVAAILVFITNVSDAYYADQERSQAKEAKKAAEQVEVVITDKVNANANGYRLEFDFVVDITNDGSKAINYVEGVLTVTDKEGNVLSSGTANFGADTITTTELGYHFPAHSTQRYTLEWQNDMTDGGVKIWESEFSDLQFSFEITRLRVENNTTADVA